MTTVSSTPTRSTSTASPLRCLPTTADGECMVERVIEVDGRQVRVGNSADAAALCHTVSGRPLTVDEYHWLVKYQGAPGPLMVPDPEDPDGPRVPSRDPVSGRPRYDLDAAAAFQAARPGQGAHGTHTAETLPRSPVRVRLLLAALAGELAVAPGPGATLVAEESQSPRIAQMRTGLERLGLLGAPVGEDASRQRSVLITDAGRAALTRWGDLPPK